MTESAVSLGNTDKEVLQRHESLVADTSAPVTSVVATKDGVTKEALNPAPLNSAPPIKSASLWYLYVVRCANGHLYTGVTTNVARRFSEHQSGSTKSAKFLRGKGPLTLMYQEQVGCQGDALRREIVVKKLSRVKKLALIESGGCVLER